MNRQGEITVSVDVAVGPREAFDAFAHQIDKWYRVSRHTVPDFTRTVEIRFEPYVGGRLLDVHDPATGAGREMGRVRAWEPGNRLVFTDNRDTEIEVTFTANGDGTRVTLVHRGIDELPPDIARHVREYGWALLLPWFADFFTAPVEATMTDQSRAKFLGVTPYLYYPDAAAALDWLARVFGFGESLRYVDDDGTVVEGEIAVGDARIMMAGRGPGPDEGHGQLLIVHVDDVDAHHAAVLAAGVDAPAPEDQPYGPRTYQVTDPWGYRWVFWQQMHEFPDGLGGLREVRV